MSDHEHGQSQYKAPTQHWHNGLSIAGIGKQIISFLLGALVAAFVFGGKTQQFTDLLVWKGEVDKTIKVIEKQGADNEYNIRTDVRDLAMLDSRLKVAEEGTKKIDAITGKLENIQKSIDELKAQRR